MDYEHLENSKAILIENLDMEHYPVQSMALERVIYLLDRLMVQVKDNEVD